MLSAVALVSFMSILGLLAALAVYDCKHYILPNAMNAALAGLFVLFHFATRWDLVSPEAAALGAVAGGGLLLLIRAVAQKFYGEDALGLGDVKLMTAAGAGLGFPDILLALSVGAGLGLLHGLVMGLVKRRKGEKVDLGRVNVPAGLGLCGGIAIVMLMRFGFRWMT